MQTWAMREMVFPTPERHWPAAYQVSVRNRCSLHFSGRARVTKRLVKVQKFDHACSDKCLADAAWSQVTRDP